MCDSATTIQGLRIGQDQILALVKSIYRNTQPTPAVEPTIIVTGTPAATATDVAYPTTGYFPAAGQTAYIVITAVNTTALPVVVTDNSGDRKSLLSQSGSPVNSNTLTANTSYKVRVETANVVLIQ